MNGQMVVHYTDFHTDDVTQTRFHPSSPHILLTGSMDGLACAIDISQTDHDEALQTSTYYTTRTR